MTRPAISNERTRFTVIVAPGLWGRRYELTIDPPTIAHPLRSFRSHGEAIAAAQEIGRVEGWSVHDRCGVI